MPSQYEILVVAGEASGDLHSADLINSIITQAKIQGINPPRFYGLGGAAMEEVGVAPLIRMEKISVIGLFEVLYHLPRIWSTFYKLVNSIKERKPQLIILVDFPDFNLRLAKKIKKYNIPIVWYISPQLWAWRSHRIHEIKRLVDHMIVLFPFEIDFYRKHGMEVIFVGHPLIDRVQASLTKEQIRKELNIQLDVPVVALLPGSRRSELKMYLKPLLDAAEILSIENPNIHFILPLARSLDKIQVEPMLKNCQAKIFLQSENTYNILKASDAAAVASGTATLETALIETPMIILGKVSKLTELWLQRVAKLPYYGLVNFIMEEACITELIQNQANPKRIAMEITKLLQDKNEQLRLATYYKEIRHRLGESGAAERAGQAIVEILTKTISNK